MLLGLHTVHLATDVYDTAVLAVLFFLKRPRERKRHVDVSENGMSRAACIRLPLCSSSAAR
jgi:cytochrome c oxidase subunit III